MTIISREEKPNRKKEIDLAGPEGNAFALIGYAKRYAKELSLNPDAIADEMMSGDYDNLVEVFDSYFGDYVNLYK